MQNQYKNIALFSCLLAVIVISLGAYTRLSDSGLGCPDWPGCYGFISVPSESHELLRAQEQFPNAVVEPTKAWIEMIHRYFAAILGLLIVAIFIMAIRNGKSLPIKHTLLLCCLVLLQGLLGMLTVTMQLQPFVVMGHLMGGFTITALLYLLYLRVNSSQLGNRPVTPISSYIKSSSYIVLGVLISQIALGGWVAANYAAPHCTGLPICDNIELFSTESLFNLPLGESNYEFGVLPFETRLSIHMLHRIWAVVTSIVIISYCWGLLKNNADKRLSSAARTVLLTLATQLIVGMLIVHFQFPILLTLFHNLMAAMLLLSLIKVCYLVHKLPAEVRCTY
jgi:heme a synthase